MTLMCPTGPIPMPPCPRPCPALPPLTETSRAAHGGGTLKYANGRNIVFNGVYYHKRNETKRATVHMAWLSDGVSTKYAVQIVIFTVYSALRFQGKYLQIISSLYTGITVPVFNVTVNYSSIILNTDYHQIALRRNIASITSINTIRYHVISSCLTVYCASLTVAYHVLRRFALVAAEMLQRLSMNSTNFSV